MSKDAPKAPDYEAAAERQAQSSREVTEQQTWANRPDQYTPFGQQTWANTPTWDPSTQQNINRWAQTTNLNPVLQQALDAQMALQRDRSQLAGSLTGRMQSEFGTPMDWAGVRPGGGAVDPREIDAAEKYRKDAEEAIYGQWASRAMPEQQRATEAQRTQLYNMGLREGDPGYADAERRLREQQSDAQRQAQYQATIGAGGEAQRMLGMEAQAAQLGFGQDLQAAQYATQQRQQEIVEMMQRRGASLNEINAMLHGQQVGMPDMPSFQGAGRAEGTQNLQAAQMTGQAALDRFNAEQQAMQGMMSGIGGIAGGFMMG